MCIPVDAAEEVGAVNILHSHWRRSTDPANDFLRGLHTLVVQFSVLRDLGHQIWLFRCMEIVLGAILEFSLISVHTSLFYPIPDLRQVQPSEP